jgi:hypothetical protein
MMIRPASFGFNEETAATNAFQARGSSSIDAQARALAEFDELARVLERRGVRVIVFDDTPSPRKTDAIFPNNWVSFHGDGTVVLYPMMAHSRRSEVRADLLARLEQLGAFRAARTIDWSDRAASGRFLEGTGSLVLDRRARFAYACRSPRTDVELVRELCAELGYEPVPFGARDACGRAIYHTNVVMSVGTSFAVACLDAIGDAKERELVRRRLQATERELVAISLAQMSEFAGNLLELASRDGRALIVMSSRARRAFDATQLAALERHGEIVDSPLDTIEVLGGGSARCMLAEIHAARRAASAN